VTLQEAHRRIDENRRLLDLASLSRGVVRIDAVIGAVQEISNVLLHLMETYDFQKVLHHDDPLTWSSHPPKV
jgi:hypothetical protein